MKTQKLNKPHQSFLKNLTDSAIELAVRPWASEDYGAVFTETLENCKTAFDAAGIVIQPYLKEMSAIKTNTRLSSLKWLP
jgi:small conductance mechanosensitive channel